MKKIVSISILLLMALMVFGQQNPVFVPGTTKLDYLKKSKKQKTAAWILLGTGTLSVLLGSIEVNPNYGESTNRPFMVVGGLVLIGTSIPYFIASKRNKKMAASISFSNQLESQINNGTWINRPVRTLHVRISL